MPAKKSMVEADEAAKKETLRSKNYSRVQKPNINSSHNKQDTKIEETAAKLERNKKEDADKKKKGMSEKEKKNTENPKQKASRMESTDKEEFVPIEKYSKLMKKYEEHMRSTTKEIINLRTSNEQYKLLVDQSHEERSNLEAEQKNLRTGIQKAGEEFKQRFSDEVAKRRKCKSDMEEYRKNVDKKLKKKFQEGLKCNSDHVKQLSAKIIIQDETIRHLKLKLEHAKLHSENLENKLNFLRLNQDEKIDLAQKSKCIQSL